MDSGSSTIGMIRAAPYSRVPGCLQSGTITRPVSTTPLESRASTELGYPFHWRPQHVLLHVLKTTRHVIFENSVNRKQRLHLLAGAVGKLAGEGRGLPNPHLFMRPFVKREAVLSSRIEGTQATLGELLASDAGAAVNGSPEDLREVANVDRLVDAGILRQTHDAKRGRVYCATRIMSILDEPPAIIAGDGSQEN